MNLPAESDQVGVEQQVQRRRRRPGRSSQLRPAGRARLACIRAGKEHRDWRERERGGREAQTACRRPRRLGGCGRQDRALTASLSGDQAEPGGSLFGRGTPATATRPCAQLALAGMHQARSSRDDWREDEEAEETQRAHGDEELPSRRLNRNQAAELDPALTGRVAPPSGSAPHPRKELRGPASPLQPVNRRLSARQLHGGKASEPCARSSLLPLA